MVGFCASTKHLPHKVRQIAMKNRRDVNMYSLIDKIQHDGHALLSSVSQFHVVAGVLGVSSLILAIKSHKIGYFPDLFSKIDGNDSSRKLSSIAGLHNLGNNCFLNVILQSLASCASFRGFIESVTEEDGFSPEEMPLIDALSTLLRELGTLHKKRLVLSPRKVMLVMGNYVSNFNLTMQQDAEEAFLLLLSSLREELLESYIPHYCTLADIYPFPPSRICSPSMGLQREQQRWQQYLLGPFDGILCSSLVCRSCSSQLSAGYEFFHSLSLTPDLDDGKTYYGGPSLKRCLEKFTSAELIENYRCNRCWHNSAVKYLSISEENEAKIEKLKCCTMEDSCNCKNFLPGKATLRSNDFSSTIKQLRVARCPQILCIHLQRASTNKFGESVKLQGHISFPMILDIFPFTKDADEERTENLNMDLRMMKVKQHQTLNPAFFKMKTEKQRLKSLHGSVEDNVISEAIVGDMLGVSARNSSCEVCIQQVEEESHVPHHKGFVHLDFTRDSLRSDNKIKEIHAMMPLKSYIYQLASVVVHFGSIGSGHYIVYRKVKSESDGQDSAGQIRPAQWFCASDSKVVRVSEKDVLGAEASLLFYERIEIPNQMPTMF